jgi:hypothetical protein
MKVQGDLAATANELRNRQEQASKAKKGEDEIQLSGEVKTLKEKIKSLRDQLTLLQKKRDLLKVVSPIRGEIIEPFRVKDTLLKKSVRQGQILFTVAKTDDKWELEVRMPENRMGHVAQAMKDLGKDLKVTYILKTNPGQKLVGHVTEVHKITNPHPEEGNTVLVRVAVDEKDFPDRQTGTGLTAKIYCGRASLGYVFFHDVIAFVQSKILFRL